jgi:cell division protein FtsA
MASAEAVLSEEEKEAGVVLVDIGGGTSDIAIFHAGIIRHTAVIPLGGEIISEDIKEGCSIIKKHAEELKVKFGSALARENREEEIVAIPGLRGRAPKEISLRNLASIIQARMEEIIEHIYYEIKNSGYEKKLIGGIVLTGGGAQLKHIAQLTEFMTGLDTRIGYPNEHLSPETESDMASPMFATGVGLVIEGIGRYQKEVEKMKPEEPMVTEEVVEPTEKKKKEKKQKEKSKPGKRLPDIFLEKIRKLFDEEVD